MSPEYSVFLRVQGQASIVWRRLQGSHKVFERDVNCKLHLHFHALQSTSPEETLATLQRMRHGGWVKSRIKIFLFPFQWWIVTSHFNSVDLEADETLRNFCCLESGFFCRSGNTVQNAVTVCWDTSCRVCKKATPSSQRLLMCFYGTSSQDTHWGLVSECSYA